MEFTQCELAALGRMDLPPPGKLEPWVYTVINHLRWALDLVICEFGKGYVGRLIKESPRLNDISYIEGQAVLFVRECLADVRAGPTRFASIFPDELRADLCAFWDRFQAMNCATRLVSLRLDTINKSAPPRPKPAPRRPSFSARGIVRNPSPLAHCFSASDLCT